MAENCAFTFISDEPGYTAALSAPFVRLSTCSAKRRHKRSRRIGEYVAERDEAAHRVAIQHDR